MQIITTISNKYDTHILAYLSKYKFPVNIEYDDNPAQEVEERRARIVEMMKRHQKKIEGDYVVCIEDDTIPQSNRAIHTLIKTIKDTKASLVTGVEVNRWAFRNIGAWKGDINKIQSVPYKDKGIEEIDACGWYFFITHVSIFKSIKFELCPNRDLGPDVWWSLRIPGKKLINWNIKCDHYTEKGILRPQDKQEVLTYNKYREIKWINK